jgi:hypothetical protein
LSESEQLREDRAKNLAYEAGRREAEVDAKLESHEARLNAINGNIRRAGDKSDTQTQAINKLRDDIREMRSEQVTQATVADALKHQSQKQITRLQFYAGLLLATGLVFLAQALHGVHF